MTSPERKKKIHDMLSPKIAEKRKARKVAAKTEAQAPAKVDNYRVNKPRVARSLNVQPVIAERRKTPKTEGMPAVNGQSGEKIVKKAVTKVKPKVKEIKASGAAIKGVVEPKKKAGGRTRKTK